MRRAAEAGEYRAMANLALLLHDDGKLDEALTWARRSVQRAPLYASGQRARGKIALAANRADEALAAFERPMSSSRRISPIAITSRSRSSRSAAPPRRARTSRRALVIRRWHRARVRPRPALIAMPVR